MSGLEARAITGRLLTVLDEAVHGASGPVTSFVDNRPGAGLFGSLALLDATDASRAVAGTSIAAHVHHVAFAMRASADWIAGERAARDWDASWQVTTVDADAWALLVERLRQEYLGLRVAIGSGALTSGDAFGEAVGATAHASTSAGK
jgi:hypothetical protein